MCQEILKVEPLGPVAAVPEADSPVASNPSQLPQGIRGDRGVSQNQGYHFGGPHNKDSRILGSILGSPYFGKLPYLQCGGHQKSIPYTKLSEKHTLQKPQFVEVLRLEGQGLDPNAHTFHTQPGSQRTKPINLQPLEEFPKSSQSKCRS